MNSTWAQDISTKKGFLISTDSLYFTWNIKDSIIELKYSIYNKEQITKRKELRDAAPQRLDRIKPALYYSEQFNFMSIKINPDTIVLNDLFHLYNKKMESDIIKPISAQLQDIIDIKKTENKTGQQSTIDPTNNIKFNMAVFSDAKGFNKDQPNGLIQTEFGFSWDLIKNPIRSTNNFNFYLLKNLVLPTINLLQTKSDSSFRYTPIHYVKTGNTVDSLTFKSTLNVHTLDLIKYAHYSISGKLNALTIQSKGKYFTFFIDLYGVFYASGVSYDSLLLKELNIKPQDSKREVYSVGGGFNLKTKFNPQNSQFSMEASITQFGLTLLSNNDISQNYGHLYTPDYNLQNYSKDNLNISKGFNGITIYTIQIRYSTLNNAKNKGETGLFLRLNFFTNSILSIIDGTTSINYGNNYTQIQIGIKKNISDLVSSLFQ